MTGPTDRLAEPLPPDQAAAVALELDYSRKLEGQINSACRQLSKCKTQLEIDIAWSNLSHLISCRTPQQILRMEISRGLRK